MSEWEWLRVGHLLAMAFFVGGQLVLVVGRGAGPPLTGAPRAPTLGPSAGVAQLAEQSPCKR
jgi:hypothetical protein